jgi:hypothetical protein
MELCVCEHYHPIELHIFSIVFEMPIEKKVQVHDDIGRFFDPTKLLTRGNFL